MTTDARPSKHPLLTEIRRSPLLWLLVFVPVVFVASRVEPEASTLLFVLSILAIVPVVVLFALVERYLVGGLTAGSLK